MTKTLLFANKNFEAIIIIMAKHLKKMMDIISDQIGNLSREINIKKKEPNGNSKTEKCHI